MSRTAGPISKASDGRRIAPCPNLTMESTLSDSPRPRLLSALITDSGHRTSSELADVTREAAAIQSQRRPDGVSKREGITRSTLLLALMNVAPRLNDALESVGIKRS